jgi:hypothetical protein
MITIFYQNFSLLPQEFSDSFKTKVSQALTARGYNYRLSAKVLSYNASPPPPTAEEVDAAEHSLYCRAVDNALPSDLLADVVEHFVGRKRNYFTEHGYTDGFGGEGLATPYFSYVASLPEQQQEASSQTVFEALVSKVFEIAVQSSPSLADKAKYVEFWAHKRPHCSGHQLHFDSDNEGLGGATHPLCSTVLYLTSDVGGPTLVTPQKLSSKLMAKQGWLTFPKKNRVVAFDGTVLHGVIPGRGVVDEDGEGGGGGKRVTLMFAFWDKLRTRSGEGLKSGDIDIGPARALPINSSADLEWIKFLSKPYLNDSATAQAEEEEVAPAKIESVFVDVDREQCKLEGGPTTFKKLRGVPDYSSVFMF